METKQAESVMWEGPVNWQLPLETLAGTLITRWKIKEDGDWLAFFTGRDGRECFWCYTSEGLWIGEQDNPSYDRHLRNNSAAFLSSCEPFEVTGITTDGRVSVKPCIDKAGEGLKGDAKTRKGLPIFSGVLMYFPDALVAIAECSRTGNDQHNPGKPLFWDRSKSGDELDALTRHLMEAGSVDTDGIRHSTKVAWRALANLQKELEKSSS